MEMDFTHVNMLCRGRDIHVAVHEKLTCTYQTEGHDLVQYGIPDPLGEIEKGILYFIPNPDLGNFIVLERHFEEAGITYFKRIVTASDEEGRQDVHYWENVSLAGWSGLPVVSMKTGKAVSVYRGVYRHPNRGTVIPSCKLEGDNSELLEAYVERILAGEDGVRVVGKTGLGKSTKLVTRLAEELKKQGERSKTIVIVNPLRSFKTV